MTLNLSKYNLWNFEISLSFLSYCNSIFSNHFILYKHKLNSIFFFLKSTAKLFKYERDCAKLIKKSYRRKFFFVLTFVVTKAEDAAIVLGSSKHINKSLLYDALHPFLKTGLLTSGGEKWHIRRKMLTPSFHFNILKEFCEIFK